MKVSENITPMNHYRNSIKTGPVFTKHISSVGYSEPESGHIIKVNFYIMS